MPEIAQQPTYIFVLKLVGIVVLAILALIVLAGVAQTYRIEHRAEQARFSGGSLPKPPPDGPYKGGQRSGVGSDWQGKTFNQKAGTGINRFNGGEKYTFKTYETKGLRDNKQVLRIDYKQAGNPWWLRFIVDEIVQVDKDKYLGKVHLKVIPGLTFTLTYFTLQK